MAVTKIFYFSVNWFTSLIVPGMRLNIVLGDKITLYYLIVVSILFVAVVVMYEFTGVAPVFYTNTLQISDVK